jgi:hypothetical protein
MALRAASGTLDPQKSQHLKALYEDFKHCSIQLNTCKKSDLISIFERCEDSFLNLKYETKMLLKQTSKYLLEFDSLRKILLTFSKNIKEIHKDLKNAVEKQLPSKFDSNTTGPINTEMKERIRALKMTKSLELNKCLKQIPHNQSIYSKKRSDKRANLVKKNDTLLVTAQKIPMSAHNLKILKIKQKKAVEKFEAKTEKKLCRLSRLEKDTRVTIEKELKVLNQALNGKHESAEDVNRALSQYKYPALVNKYTMPG